MMPVSNNEKEESRRGKRLGGGKREGGGWFITRERDGLSDLLNNTQISRGESSRTRAGEWWLN